MSITHCVICKRSFYAKKSHLKIGWYKCCSIKCRTSFQKKGKEVNCFSCNNLVYRSLGQIKKSASGKFFCSITCQTIWRNKLYIEEGHKNWSGGVRSYREILKRTDKERVCFCCNTKDARVLVVHHIDHNRNNNVKSNLMWLCHNCHHLVHNNHKFNLKLNKKINSKTYGACSSAG